MLKTRTAENQDISYFNSMILSLSLKQDSHGKPGYNRKTRLKKKKRKKRYF